MKRLLFWRLFIILALGGVIFFSLLHSAAILSDEKMSYLDEAHQQEILDWGKQAQRLYDAGDQAALDAWINNLSEQQGTWIAIVESNLSLTSGKPLEKRFWEGFTLGRGVDWKIHLYFSWNPIMEVTLIPDNQHFLVLLPDRMRPGTYMSHALWFFRVILPFTTLLALSIYLYRYVMRPLMHFKEVSNAFSQGDYDARISQRMPLGQDEISQIARTFDHMANRTSQVIEHNRNLISDMSHEIRTPIARIETALDCLDQDIRNEEMRDKIRREINAIRTMAEDTLTLAWIENEQPQLKDEDFDMSELLEVLLEDARFEFQDKIVTLDIPENMPVSQSNQRALAQALENIIRNGLRYTPERETLAIKAKLVETNWVISIIDGGDGLDQSLHQSIFKPFFKANNQQGCRKGYGVGLALAKRHIEAVGGTISVDNADQMGLAFTITLPR